MTTSGLISALTDLAGNPNDDMLAQKVRDIADPNLPFDPVKAMIEAVEHMDEPIPEDPRITALRAPYRDTTRNYDVGMAAHFISMGWNPNDPPPSREETAAIYTKALGEGVSISDSIIEARRRGRHP